ncbi:hypothetical protein ACFQ0B_26285 [Nonomuraea thailandensis]
MKGAESLIASMTSPGRTPAACAAPPWTAVTNSGGTAAPGLPSTWGPLTFAWRPRP